VTATERRALAVTAATSGPPEATAQAGAPRRPGYAGRMSSRALNRAPLWLWPGYRDGSSTHLPFRREDGNANPAPPLRCAPAPRPAGTHTFSFAPRFVHLSRRYPSPPQRGTSASPWGIGDPGLRRELLARGEVKGVRVRELGARETGFGTGRLGKPGKGAVDRGTGVREASVRDGFIGEWGSRERSVRESLKAIGKSAFQIPHHVAIRIFVYAPPRCFSAENSGAGGDGFPHSAENG